MRQIRHAGPRSARPVVLVVLSALLLVGIFATAAPARFQPDSVVPVFCTSDTIPATTQLTLRLRWAVSNVGQMNGFLAAQKLTWTIYAADGTTVLATSAPPNPEFGDTTSWSPLGQEEGMITTKTGAVKRQKFTYSDYRQATGVTVGLNQTVIRVRAVGERPDRRWLRLEVPRARGDRVRQQLQGDWGLRPT